LAERPSPSDRPKSTGDSGSTTPGSNPGPKPGAEPGQAPGLGHQVRRTRDAVLGLIAAHVDLARAEFSDIAGEVKKAAALGGLALLLILLTGLLLVIGLALFIGEALFGSMGWGVLLGTELMLALAAMFVLAIIELTPARVVEAIVIALFVSVVVAAILLSNWAWFARTYVGTPDLAVELVVAIVVGGVIGLIVGSLVGSAAAIGGLVGFAILAVAVRLLLGTFARTETMVAVLAAVVILGIFGAWLAPGRSRMPATIGLLLGALIGILIGLIAGAHPSRHVVGAVAAAAWLLVLPIATAYFVFSHGIDMEKLKKRFLPQQTIDTTKETIEWVREQMPLGRKS
jgi:uncharacterized membrane protein YqjE